MEAYEFHEQRQLEMQNRVIWILASLSLIYAFFLFPDRALEIAISTADPLGKAIARLVGWASCMASLRFLMFASDPLFKGSGRAPRFVRTSFASRAAEERFGCSSDEATELWFKYFDTWGNPANPNHMLMRVTYVRTYQARLVYCLQRFLIGLALVSAATILLNHFAFGAFEGSLGTSRLLLQCVVAGGFVVGYAALAASNRLPSASGGATGVWRQLYEVFQRSRVEFAREVLDDAGDLRHAFRRVEDIRLASLAPPATAKLTPAPKSRRPQTDVPDAV
ncbi:MAG: hypothetical protein HYR85_09505 [Planctomycetes bacterium]|nr:hypothetical protein [Planctomycetota bacterium]MBI3847670.1 hypothetical protein [Planctomycetota bacterium]